MELPESDAAYATLETTPRHPARSLKAVLTVFAVAAVVACAVGLSVSKSLSHHSTTAPENAKLAVSSANQPLTATQEAELLAVRGYDKCKPLLAEAEAAIRANATTTTTSTVWTASDHTAPPPGVRVILEPRTLSGAFSKRGYRRWQLEEVRDVLVICGEARLTGDELSYFPSLVVITGRFNAFLADGEFPSLRWNGDSRIPSWWSWLIGRPDPHRWFPRVTAVTNFKWSLLSQEPVDAFPELVTIQGSVEIETWGGGPNIGFKKLKHVNGRLYVGAGSGQALGLPELTSAGTITFEAIPGTNMPSQTRFEVRWPKLKHVRVFHLTLHPNVRVVDLPALERIGKLVVAKTGVVTLDLPAATNIDRLVVNGNAHLETIRFDKLSELGSVFIDDNRSLLKLTPHLNSVISRKDCRIRCLYGYSYWKCA